MNAVANAVANAVVILTSVPLRLVVLHAVMTLPPSSISKLKGKGVL